MIDVEKMIIDNMKLVYHIVYSKYKNLYVDGFDIDDVIQTGFIGLINGVNKINKNPELLETYKESTVLCREIECEILNFIRKQRCLKRFSSEEHVDYEKVEDFISISYKDKYSDIVKSMIFNIEKSDDKYKDRMIKFVNLYLKGYSFKDISDITGWNRGVVYKTFKRCRKYIDVDTIGGDYKNE